MRDPEVAVGRGLGVCDSAVRSHGNEGEEAKLGSCEVLPLHWELSKDVETHNMIYYNH